MSSIRWDNAGVFWEEAPKEKKKGGGYVNPRKPSIPETGWEPKDFPDLSAADLISFDIETKDTDLRDKGPGCRRDGNRIVGISVGVMDGHRPLTWYFPFGHEHDPNKLNLEEDKVMAWARRELCRTNQPKTGANLLYDLDWLWSRGVPVTGPFLDVQVAEPLIDESAFTYALDALGEKYLQEGKDDDQLYQWLSLAYGGNPTRSDQARNIWRAPPELVGPYAESDAALPIRILQRQLPILDRDGLNDIWTVETELTELLLAMRQRGVRVDVSRAEEAEQALDNRAADLLLGLSEIGIDPWSNDTIAAYCQKNQLFFQTTELGNPSFRSAWLEKHSDEVLRTIAEIRKLDKHKGTFISGAVLGNVIGDRIHCQFHQLRGDGYGTVSGRFSSSHPNLQNIPARDEELGPLVRSLFVPEPDEVWWCDDWSQIEFRLLVHYGTGPSAERTRVRYRTDPSTDFHRFVSDLTGIPRGPAKNINFGLVYGMGIHTFAGHLGITPEEVTPLFDQYHGELPFVKDAYNRVQRKAERAGFIHTILGRRRRFDAWQSSDFETSRNEPPIGDYEAAVAKWGKHSIRRAFCHKALNSLLQGGAADIMKKAMVDIWKAGICNVLGAPLLTVHDELNWSVPRSSEAEEAHEAALQIMRTCVPLRLPLVVSSQSGAHWGEAK